jgi:hypothetical protein
LSSWFLSSDHLSCEWETIAVEGCLLIDIRSTDIYVDICAGLSIKGGTRIRIFSTDKQFS